MNTLIRLLLVQLGERILTVFLSDKQMNNLGERGLVGNFILDNFVSYNFIQ